MRFGTALSQFRCNDRSEMIHPASDCFVRNYNFALREQILDVTKAKREPEIEPDRLVNDLRREPISGVADFRHALRLPSRRRRDNAVCSPQAHPSARSPAPERSKRRKRRVPACRHRPKSKTSGPFKADRRTPSRDRRIAAASPATSRQSQAPRSSRIHAQGHGSSDCPALLQRYRQRPAIPRGLGERAKSNPSPPFPARPGTEECANSCRPGGQHSVVEFDPKLPLRIGRWWASSPNRTPKRRQTPPPPAQNAGSSANAEVTKLSAVVAVACSTATFDLIPLDRERQWPKRACRYGFRRRGWPCVDQVTNVPIGC